MTRPNPSTPPGNATPSTQSSSPPFSKSVSGNSHDDRRRIALYPFLESDLKRTTTISFSRGRHRSWSSSFELDATPDRPRVFSNDLGRNLTMVCICEFETSKRIDRTGVRRGFGPLGLVGPGIYCGQRKLPKDLHPATTGRRTCPMKDQILK